MGIRILINIQPLETRVAVLEDGRLVDFELEREQKIVGSLFKGKVADLAPGIDAAFVELGLSRNGFLYVGDVDPARFGKALPTRKRRYDSIEDALKLGEELLVQVMRPPVGSKGARLTTRLSLQGRYVVLMIGNPGQLGVSRGIQDKSEQKRLRKLAATLRPLDHGLIVRTDAEGRNEADLRADLRELETAWERARQLYEEVPAPALLHQEPGLAERTLRERSVQEVEEIVVDSPTEFERCRQLLLEVAPDIADRLRLAEGKGPLFDEDGVEQQVHEALARSVSLPSGGRLTFDETEALTTIDVDTGRFVGGSHAADTILRTNLEAVAECARQLRLRDLGGIVIIDFIDMDRVRDRVQVMDALEAELARDRMHPRIVHLSPLGLVELTRRRRGLSLSQMMRVSCPFCAGLGEVASATTVAADARRQVLRLCAQEQPQAVALTVHPEVAAQLLEDDGVRQLEAESGARVTLVADTAAHPESIEVTSGAREDLERACPRPAEGLMFEVSLADEHLVPHGHPLYLPRDGALLRLPLGLRRSEQSLSLRVTESGRWYCRTEVASRRITDHPAAQ